MTDQDKQELAELGHYPAFRTLVALWAEHEVGLLADLAAASTDFDVLRRSRQYQLFRYCREFLESVPLSAEHFQRLVAEREAGWDTVPRSIDDLFRSRYTPTEGV